MNKEIILSDLQTIFRSLFNNDNLQLTRETAQGDIDQWDSLNHAMLIDRIEKRFDIKFNLMDMLAMQNVGQICDKILAKTDNQ